MNDAVVPFFDGHNDTLLLLHERGAGAEAFLGGTGGHLDLPLARSGGLAAGFFAVFIPNDPAQPPVAAGELPAPLELGHAQRATHAMIATLHRIGRAAPGAVRVVRAIDDLAVARDTSALAAVLHLEGADAIDESLDALEVYHQAGVRSLGIVWSRPNRFGSGVPFRFPHDPDIGPGLSDAGKALVRACNELGIVIDLSHLNAAGFRDVAAHSRAPLVATHSNVHAICPSPRNLTAWQLDAIRDSGGMVGVNLHVGFLRPDGLRTSDTPIDVVVDHFVALVEQLGIGHVGLGSDFDGALMPAALADAGRLQHLAQALRRRGFDEADVRRLAYDNWRDLLARTWR